MVATLFQKLDDLVTEEARALASGDLRAIRDVNHRKSQLLLELDRAGRKTGSGSMEPALVEAAASLRARLAAHRDLIGRHVAALSELTGLIAGAIRGEESDGTYTASQLRRASKP